MFSIIHVFMALKSIYSRCEMAKGLIVDDSKFMRKIIREALEEAGHEVIAEAECGNEGIEDYKAYSPDFVTMDITMGGKDGINAIREIYKIDKKANIIVVSALNEKTIRMNDKKIKASAYVLKPFEKKTLIEAIDGTLK